MCVCVCVCNVYRKERGRESKKMEMEERTLHLHPRCLSFNLCSFFLSLFPLSLACPLLRIHMCDTAPLNFTVEAHHTRTHTHTHTHTHAQIHTHHLANHIQSEPTLTGDMADSPPFIKHHSQAPECVPRARPRERHTPRAAYSAQRRLSATHTRQGVFGTSSKAKALRPGSDTLTSTCVACSVAPRLRSPDGRIYRDGGTVE